MTTEGQKAPRFELPGTKAGQFEQFRLTDVTESGNAVLLVFFPFDFSPVCETELRAIRDAEWFEFTPNLTAWAISGDSSYAHKAFAEQFDISFPMLSDSAGRVAESYGVLYDEWEAHERVPKWAVVLVDSDRTIQYRWVTEDALVRPDFAPVKAAVDVFGELYDEPATDEFDLNYGET